ncbi:unannotated protein [freshwater metagenome]|uniref:Unannotated protein n=1 Tax=freshwater metagenome TaxID=449393 RepID=A0A6J7LXU7_9ZZZZ|nr:hypothetical protein [Actinomycetota bacterium]MSW62174.1 hypothetical protein [Actinomycetota bacterium]MSX89253.1 hypothetical protein [Actinomycetota bacterium]MSZ63666.1 hypothetical protein [Actinomycetota bacterium]MTA58641.1 hypothetical protein [Actinomycetota bacterium]
MVLRVDLGQSGTRLRMGDISINSTRGKLAGEQPLSALRSVFEDIEKLSSEVVALSCTGFGGIVTDPDEFGALCKEFFGAKKVAVIDDGLAGFFGALHGANGVVLSIGGGVVAVGGRDGEFAHRDGLGSTFGDEGGGFWLGKLGITKALAVRQGRASDADLLEAFHAQLLAYDRLESKNGSEAATLAIESARTLLDAADSGAKSAVAIRNEGAHLLAQTVIATWLGVHGPTDASPQIAIAGGPSANTNYVDAIQNSIKAALPNAQFISALGDNLDGALWIAEKLTSDAPPLLRWSHEL